MSRKLTLHSLTAIVTSAICLIGASISFTWLYRDFHTRSDQGKGPTIASLAATKSVVKRKLSSSYRWHLISPNEAFFFKDTIQTGENSEAKIRMLNGTELEIGESSLVVLDQTSDLTLGFLKGSVVLRKNGEDTKVTVDSSGKKKIEILPARLIGPEPGAELVLSRTQDPSAKIKFTWEPRAQKQEGGQTSDQENGTLQISKVKSFKTLIDTEVNRVDAASADSTTANKKQTAAATLAPGTYYWRVKTGERATEARSLRLVMTSSIQLQAPNQESRIQTFNESAPVSFRWTVPREIASNAKHELEVSNDFEFKNVLKKESVSISNGVLSLTGIATGRYFWRIKSTYANSSAAIAGPANSGDPAQLRIVESTNPPLSFAIEQSDRFAVSILNPKPEAALEKPNRIRFAWTSEAPDCVYEFELKNTKSKEVIKKQKSKASAFDWAAPLEGHYQWQVKGWIKEQLVAQSEWTSVSLFSGTPITLIEPKDQSRVLFWKDEPELMLRFKTSPTAQSIEVAAKETRIEIAKDPQFTQELKTQAITRNEIALSQFKLGLGTFYWRVRQFDDEGKPLKTSSTNSFTFQHYGELVASSQVSVNGSNTFNLITEERKPEIRWSEVKDATEYELTVTQIGTPELDAQAAQMAAALAGASGPRGRALAGVVTPLAAGERKVVVQKALTQTQFKLDTLTAGKYAITIRAKDPLGRFGAATAEKQIVLTTGEVLRAPKVRSKAVQ